MPEEINRMVTDAISDYFFVTEESGSVNLLREGKSAGQVHFVEHVMIDNLPHQVGKMKMGEIATAPVLVQSCRLNQTLTNGSGCKPEPAKSNSWILASVGMTEGGAGLAKGEYAFMTLNRPSNVAGGDTFCGIAAALNEIAAEMPIIFPVHPRTRRMMEQF